MNIAPNIKYTPARNEILHAYSSHEKVQRIFGEQTLHSLEDGLAQMAAWVKKHGARSSQEFEQIGVTKNFSQAWLGK